MDVIISYDISTITPKDDRRLRAVAKLCEGYGVRVQASVFEARLSETSLTQMMLDLDDLIDHDRDSIHLYRLSGPIQDTRTTIGRIAHHQFGKPWIV